MCVWGGIGWMGVCLGVGVGECVGVCVGVCWVDGCVCE